MSDFKNAPHRLESCGKWNGVEFINDSKATNVDAVYYALNSYKQPLILLMGGVDKGNEYDVFNKNTLEYCFNNVKHMAIEIHVKATLDGPSRFIQFRDEFLKPFAESSKHKVRSMDQDDFINTLWDNEVVRNLPISRSYFMLYITRDD